MDIRGEISEFLRTRRAKITPEQAGLPSWGGSRRVKGLRREEVAQLAGVSADYYARLERGNLVGVSDSVLENLARALHLDEPERAHLFDFARTVNAGPLTRHRPVKPAARAGLVRMIESMTESPAFVMNRRRDILAENDLGRALFADLYAEVARPVNTARFAFLSPKAAHFYVDWDRAADDTVANLRTDAGRNPFDKGLTDLIGELVVRSDDFRIRWASHDVRYHHTGFKSMRHPVVGEIRLGFEVMELPADPGLSLIAYTADSGTPAADSLRMLASWSAAQRADAAEARPDRSSQTGAQPA